MILAHVTAGETSLMAGLILCGMTMGILIAERLRQWIHSRHQK